MISWYDAHVFCEWFWNGSSYTNYYWLLLLLLLLLQELEGSLQSAPGKLYALKCDVTKEQEIKEAFKWVKDNLGGVDILVNNAGGAWNNTLCGNSDITCVYWYLAVSPVPLWQQQPLTTRKTTVRTNHSIWQQQSPTTRSDNSDHQSHTPLVTNSSIR
jgi:hypothetical protein